MGARPVGAAYRWACGIRCSGCGQVPTNPITRAEVAMTWLLPGPGGVRQARFCRGCVPDGPVADLACVRCGDGPLLGGVLAAGDPAAIVVVQDWMSRTGWRTSGPVCPDCVGELGR